VGDKEAQGARAAPSLIQIVGGFFGMKKLIAISVVFVLLAGAAFAETSIGGAAHASVVLAEGSTVKDAANNDETPDIGVGGDAGRVRIDATGTSDDGKFGGYVRFDAGSDFGGVTGWANAWWKPIDALKILIGSAGYDGFFGLEGGVGYGYYGGASQWGNIGVVTDPGAFAASFIGGFQRGLILTLAPIDGLEVNVGVPFFDNATAEDAYKKTRAQVKYSVDGIGTFGLTYDGALGDTATLDTTTYEFSTNKPKLYLYVGISAIENVGIDFGLGYQLAFKEEIAGVNLTYNTPLAAGLGVNFSAGQFGIKARVQGQFAGSLKSDVSGADPYKVPLVVDFDLLPSFAVSDNLSIALDAGIKFIAENKEPDGTKIADSNFSWHVNPYLTFDAWPGTFYAGLNFSSDGVERTDSKGGKYKAIYWAVPIGIAYSL